MAVEVVVVAVYIYIYTSNGDNKKRHTDTEWEEICRKCVLSEELGYIYTEKERRRD